MASKRSRTWLLFASLLAGVAVAATRVLRQPSSAPAEPRTFDNPDAAVKPVALDKPVTETRQPDPADTAEIRAVQPAVPQLAFVPEAPATAYAPPAGHQSSPWENVSPEELVPGFGAVPLAGDPWAQPSGAPEPPGPLVPPGPPELVATGKPAPLTRLSTAISEWRNRTPRREMIYTVVGAVCVLAAVITTVVVLSL